MKKIILLLILSTLTMCGRYEELATNSESSNTSVTGCTVESATNGANVTCNDETVFIANGSTGIVGANGLAGTNGTDGTNGANGSNGANGTDGTNGTNGTNGLSSLIAITAEAAGANCANGGQKVDSGIDDNSDGTLQVGEIDATAYVCNGAGATGANGFITVSGLSGNVSETGTTATFTVVLGSAPTGTVIVNFDSNAKTEAVVDSSSLTFNSGNWSVAQTVTVTGVDDSIVDFDKSFTIVFTAVTGTDTRFWKISNNVTGTNIDNDRYMFTSAVTTNGAIGSIVAADTICNTDANRPNTTLTYKAMLVDGTNRIASTTANAGDGQVDWVLKANHTYIRSNNSTVIFTANANAIYDLSTLTLTNSVDTAGDSVWTGLVSDWTTDADTCSAWTDTAVNGIRGRASAANQQVIVWNARACTNLYKLYCVHQ